MIDKYESRRIRVDIRRVLLDVWDPIGIAREPNAQDEYDGYLGDVFHLLTEGGTDAQIADYLWKTATDHMGLTVSKEEMTPTVEALRKIQLPLAM